MLEDLKDEDVSLREEGVDLSLGLVIFCQPIAVSLREEGVDLSQYIDKNGNVIAGLPPRGGSGFKPRWPDSAPPASGSPSARREWI